MSEMEIINRLGRSNIALFQGNDETSMRLREQMIECAIKMSSLIEQAKVHRDCMRQMVV